MYCNLKLQYIVTGKKKREVGLVVPAKHLQMF